MEMLDAVPEVSSEPLGTMASGYQISQILFTAVEYDIFTLLKEPRTGQQISVEIKTDPYLTEKFLNALVALQLLSKMDDRYSNTELAATFLVKGEPFYQGNLLRLMARGYDHWSHMGQALKDRGIQKTPQEKHEYIDRIFTLGHAEGAMCGALQRAVSAVAALPEFKKARKLLDLGGGHGLYAIAFAQLNPELDIAVFDLPHVIEITRNYLGQYGMQERVRVIAGDFTQDDLGNGYDIIFASDVTLFGALERIYDALKDDGILIYRRWTLDDNGASPLTSALFELMLSLTRSEHHVYRLAEYIKFLEQAGFSIAHVMDVSTPSDPTKIMIARKEV